MERPSIVGTGARVSRNYRDNMFKDLFSREEYLLRLYKWKHPDDRRTTISDIRLEGLTDCISVGIKNGLGFSVRGRRIVLVEAQTTLSLNILPRMLGYLIDTWNIEPMRQRGDFHAWGRAPISKPGFLIINTGGHKFRDDGEP